MNVDKNGNILTITLTEEESAAVDYLIQRRGKKGFLNGLQAWMDTRTKTVESESKREIYGIFKGLTPAEKIEFRSKKRG